MSFIKLCHGDNETLLLNIDCSCRLFVDYVRQKCEVSPDMTMDIIDDNAWMAELYSKNLQDSLVSVFKPRGVYILASVELDEEQTVTKITPLLKEWEKKYQFLDRKLKHWDKKQAKAASEAPPPEATPQAPPITKDGKLNKKKSKENKSEVKRQVSAARKGSGKSRKR
ncbi:hypothetical protein FSP39_000226 [Pinctada imbricata]|uniref:Uncharacterized protein n=1 Tax=Pinctada imbricata TaxID=66713 RepID=A0AA89BQZ1_PINIB|nr:hypothetical protein FSP39_000226 [Pinctada imbricata]